MKKSEWVRLTKLGQVIVDAACNWHASSAVSQYGVGDCCSGVPLDAIYAAVLTKTKHQIDGAIATLRRNGYLMVRDDAPDEISPRCVRLDPPSWLSWSNWNPEDLADILNSEAGQDWGAEDYDAFMPTKR